MSPLLMIASIAITAALVFYTIGVFAERRAGHLNGKHLSLFWLGLVCDTTGTTVMTIMARSGAAGEAAPAIHGVTGLLVGIPMIHMETVPAVIVSCVIVAVLAVILLKPAKDRK